MILKIDDEIYFSNVFISNEFDSFAIEQNLGGLEFDNALLQFVFHMESCDEAIASFDGFAVCPICGEHAVKGEVKHKKHEDMVH